MIMSINNQKRQSNHGLGIFSSGLKIIVFTPYGVGLALGSEKFSLRCVYLASASGVDPIGPVKEIHGCGAYLHLQLN